MIDERYQGRVGPRHLSPEQLKEGMAYLAEMYREEASRWPSCKAEPIYKDEHWTIYAT